MKVAPRILFLFGCLIAASTVIGVVQNYSPVPFWDQWFGTVAWYMRSEQNWWGAFWSLHNEHRLLFSRLIFWPDMRWFGGVNILSLASNVIVCGLLALAAYRAAVFRAAQSTAIHYCVAGVALAFCFSWMQVENFTWGFQSQWFAVNLFALLAFHSITVSASKEHSVGWFSLSLISATVATFSMANGVLAWPLLLLLMWYWRFPWRMPLLAVGVAIIEIVGYFWHAQGATGSIPHGTPSYVIRHQLVDLLHYTALYLGSPIWYALHRFGLATVAGVLVVAGTVMGFLYAINRRNLSAISLLALAGFLCGTAFITGTGRLVLGLDNVFQSRYSTNGLLAWMALFLFWLLNASSRTTRRVLYAGLAVSLASIAISQRTALKPDRSVIFDRLVAGQAVRDQVYDHRYLGILWDHDDYLVNIINEARRQQLTILAPHARGFDDPPAQITSTERCTGYIDATEPTQTPGKSRAEGWVFNQMARSVPAAVAITDLAGQTIGAGVVGKDRPDAAAATGAREKRLGWVAFYNTTAQIHVFAKIGDGHYCRIS
jgi:hypothetical protein